MAVIVGYSFFSFRVANDTNTPIPQEFNDIINIRPLNESEIQKLGDLSPCNITPNNLISMEIPYINFSGESVRGTLIVPEEYARITTDLFVYLYDIRFPINKIDIAGNYNNDDTIIMNNNITTSFNCRLKTNGNTISNHAKGAIDINPMQNPYISGDTIVPANAKYDVSAMGTISHEIAYSVKSLGYEWGGDWKSIKDYQHFEPKE